MSRFQTWLVQPEGPSLLGPGAGSEGGQHSLSQPILWLPQLASFCAVGVASREWESVVSSWLAADGQTKSEGRDSP